MEQFLPLIMQLIAGAVGGNAAGAAAKNVSLGGLGNTIAGAVGGGALGQLLPMILPMLASAGAGGNMTEKIARRGVRVPSEYAADFLDQIEAGKACTREVVPLRVGDRLGDIRHWLNSGDAKAQHQGYPVLDADGRAIGVLTRRDLLDMRLPDMHRIGQLVKRAPIVVREDHSLREAADHMVAENVGRVIVVAAQAPHAMVGILTRGDLLAAHADAIEDSGLVGVGLAGDIGQRALHGGRR